MKKDLISYMWRQKYLYLMVLPGMALLFVFSYIPMYGILIAFERFSITKGILGSEWVGLKWFVSFFSSPDAWKIIKNTLSLNILSLVICFPAPIIFALMLNEMRGKLYKQFIQTVSYMPHFLSTVAIVGMAVNFLSPSTGLVNALLTKAFNIEPIFFMVQPGAFKPLYIIISLWQSTGWSAIIYFAALSSLDPQLYESAVIDGAGRLKQIWHISLPGILPTIVILLLLNLGSILNVSFEMVFLLQTPFNLDTSEVIATYVYKRGIKGFEYGFATAVGVVQSAIGFVLIVLSNKLAKKTTETGLW